jgi:hypothetical protein
METRLYSFTDKNFKHLEFIVITVQGVPKKSDTIEIILLL